MVKLTLMEVEGQCGGDDVYVNPSQVFHVKNSRFGDAYGCYVHLGGAANGHGFWVQETAEVVVQAIEHSKKPWPITARTAFQ
jgi:hypothetical protein